MKGMGLQVSGSLDLFVKTYSTDEEVKELMMEQITDPNMKYKHWKKVQENDKYRWKEIEETLPKAVFIKSFTGALRIQKPCGKSTDTVSRNKAP